MDPVLSTYLYLFLLIIVINVVPAFMPASWMVLAFFAISFHLNVPAVVILGVTASTIGRTGLYFLSERYVARFLSAKQNTNMVNLGKIIEARAHGWFWLISSFWFLPLPSNHIYIAAGVSRFDFKKITAAFVIGRTFNYTLMVGGSSLVLAGFSDIIEKSVTSPLAIIIQIGGLVLLYLATIVDWQKFFRASS